MQNRDRLGLSVATHTISLQEQLIDKDLPFLNSVIPLEFSAVLVKGRSNYISLRRLKNAMERMQSLFDDDEEYEQLREIEKWSKETTDGSLADLDFRPMLSVWDEVASDHGNCYGPAVSDLCQVLLLSGQAADAACADFGGQSRLVFFRPGLADAGRQHLAALPRCDLRRGA